MCDYGMDECEALRCLVDSDPILRSVFVENGGVVRIRTSEQLARYREFVDRIKRMILTQNNSDERFDTEFSRP
jgi:hypothetical protein